MGNWRKGCARTVIVLWAAVAFTQIATGSEATMQTKDERKLEREARRIDGEANNSVGEDRVLDRMSSDLGVPVETLRQQQRTSGLSFGNLFIANSLARSTGKSFDEILATRRSGKGWGQIARENNVRLGEVVSRMKRSSNSVEANRRQEEQRRARAAEARQGDNRRRRADGSALGRPSTDRGSVAATPGGGLGRGRRR